VTVGQGLALRPSMCHATRRFRDLCDERLVLLAPVNYNLVFMHQSSLSPPSDPLGSYLRSAFIDGHNAIWLLLAKPHSDYSVIIQMFSHYHLQHRLIAQAALSPLFPEPLNQILIEQN